MQIFTHYIETVSYKLAEPITQQWQTPLKRELPKDTMKVGLFLHLHIAPLYPLQHQSLFCWPEGRFV